LAEIIIRDRRKKEEGTSIYVVRTTIGQEKLVANSIELRLNNMNGNKIKAILVPEVLKGYIFIESTEASAVVDLIKGLRHVRGYNVVGKVDISDIEKYLIPTPSTEGLHVNDIVEIISGIFKGEKAKITRVDTAKDEVVLELFESPHPIPIKVSADHVKRIEAAAEEEPAKGAKEAEKEVSEIEEEEEEEETERFFNI